MNLEYYELKRDLCSDHRPVIIDIKGDMVYLQCARCKWKDSYELKGVK